MDTSIEWFMARDHVLLEFKRKAKQLFRKNKHVYTLMQAQDLLAREAGYQSWFDLHNKRKLHYMNDEIPQLRSNMTGQIQQYFESILHEAVEKSVTDIHFEMRKNEERIRFRIFGDIIDYQPAHFMPVSLNEILNQVTQDYLNLSEYAWAETEKIINKERYTLRFQSLPVYPEGFDLVLRLEPRQISKTSLEALGYSPENIESLFHFYNDEPGLFLANLDNGAQSSIMIKKTIQALDKMSSIKLMDLKKTDLSASEMLDFLNKTRPDLTLIPEILDNESASNMRDLIESKHSLISCIQAKNTHMALSRMEDFGLANSETYLKGILLHKTIGTLCPHCKINLLNDIKENNTRHKKLYTQLSQIYAEAVMKNIFVRGPGCKHCHGVQLGGATVCAEVIDLQNISSDSAVLQADYDGTLQVAIKKMLQGMISPEDIQRRYQLDWGK